MPCSRQVRGIGGCRGRVVEADLRREGRVEGRVTEEDGREGGARPLSSSNAIWLVIFLYAFVPVSN